MKISELSKQAACPIQAIRYYEKEGLLPPPARSAGNYRIYGGSHLDRLRFIRHCRNLHMTLVEIRQLLRLRDSPQESCEEVNAVLDEHIEQVAQRIGELRSLEAHLKELRQRCDAPESTRECAILRELAATEASAPIDTNSVEPQQDRFV